MEDSTHAPYRDSPLSPHPTPIIPQSSGTRSIPSVAPTHPVDYTEPYRDDPSSNPHIQNPSSQSRPPRYRSTQVNIYVEQYTDNPRDIDNDDDVPLAHLFPYPTEAPPAYHIAVRQSFRDTLISHIPDNSRTISDVDEELGIEPERADDIRYKVEKVVSALVVSGILLILLAVMVGLIWMNGGL